ncbi:MAG: SDR family oxidoreductase [Candidatus Velthaea sp.]
MTTKSGRLEGRIAVITGAASGIGRATMETFAREGARIVAVDMQPVAVRDVDFAVQADIADPAAVAAFVAQAVERLGPIDVLAHFAGITRDAIADSMTIEAWDTVLRVNLTGSFVVAQAVARAMNDGGSIVFASSVSAYGNIGQANYAASKAGVIGLTRTLALELGKRKIRVNAVAPGFIETPMTKTVPEKIRDRAIAATPLRRTGLPEEVAAVALFFASDDAAYVTGQVLNVDGGRKLSS